MTIDPDVEQMLRDRMRQRQKSFKETLNEALRKGLGSTKTTSQGPYQVEALAMGLRTGVDPARLNQLNDELEADAFLETTRRLLRERVGRE